MNHPHSTDAHESSRIQSELMQTRWRGCKPEPTEGGPQPIERQGRLPLALPGAMAPDAQQGGTQIGKGWVEHMEQKGVGQCVQEQQLLPHLPVLHPGVLEGQLALADAPDAFNLPPSGVDHHHIPRRIRGADGVGGEQLPRRTPAP